MLLICVYIYKGLNNYAGDLDKRRSLIGYVFTIGGCANSRKATLQSIIAFPTTEAKYMPGTEACMEALWLKGLFRELSDQLQINTCFMIAKVLYFSPKISCFIRGQSISM